MIDINSFIEFCRSLVGSKIKTAGGQKQFVLSSAQYNKLCYKVSTGKTRTHTRERIKMVLDRYEKAKSLKPRDYQDISVNASYILPLINRYCSKHPC
jgi:hypothetical protein